MHHTLSNPFWSRLFCLALAALPLRARAQDRALAPAVVITDRLSEDQPVGATQRPEWTSARRFPGTRVYLQQDPWEVGVESWRRLQHHRDGTLSHRLLEEVGGRGNAAQQFNIGPSIQYRVTPNLHIDINCLFGTNEDFDRQIAFLVVGYDFGRLDDVKKSYIPTSGLGR